MRAVIDAIAQTTDEEPEELVEAATRDAWFKMERTKRETEKVERDLRNMSRERLLPDEKTLEKVARYEAHLSRGLYKAMHELEAEAVRSRIKRETLPTDREAGAVFVVLEADKRRSVDRPASQDPRDELLEEQRDRINYLNR